MTFDRHSSLVVNCQLFDLKNFDLKYIEKLNVTAKVKNIHLNTPGLPLFETVRVGDAHPDIARLLANLYITAAVREDWAAMTVVPVDDRCLARAVELGATFGLRSVDAIHLAAADRLPTPVTFVSFDRHQLPAAAALGFEVISPLAV